MGAPARFIDRMMDRPIVPISHENASQGRRRMVQAVEKKPAVADVAVTCNSRFSASVLRSLLGSVLTLRRPSAAEALLEVPGGCRMGHDAGPTRLRPGNA